MKTNKLIKINKDLSLNDCLEINSLFRNLVTNEEYFSKYLESSKSVKVYLFKDYNYFYKINYKRLKLIKVNSRKTKNNLLFLVDRYYNQNLFTINYYGINYYRQGDYNIFSLDRDNKNWYLIIENLY